MGKYSELIGSFIRTGNFPLEANFVFYSEAELKEFYEIPENKATLHRGWMKIVVNQETGLQSLWWVTKKQTNDELEFTKLIDAESIEDLKEALEDLEKRLEQEIQDRIDGDNAIWGTENPTIIPEDLNSILDLANAVTEIRATLEEHAEAIELLRKQLKATVGTEEDDIIAYLQTLDYKSLTEVSEALHKWLEEYDAEDEKINTLPELQAFLEGFTDRDTLLQILTDLWYNIQGSPLPSEEFRTLRGIEDFVRVFKAEIEHQADNIQTELDQTQVGVGLSADGAYSPDQETYYLKDSTSVMNALKTLDWYINEAIKYCRIRPTDTNTVDLTVNHYDEYNEIIADVKISKETGNGIIAKEDGLYHKVMTEYSADGILTLKVNEEIVAQHNLGLAYIGISSAYYDPATEDLVIIFEKEDTSTEELRIPVYTLIREWTVNNTHPTDVVELTRKEVLGGAPDELSADVRLFEDKYNILVKEGNTLYVKGTSSNIIHDGDITVEHKLNELDERVTTLENKSDDLEERLEKEIEERKAADEALQEQITANDTDISNLQKELDDTQAGAGLDVNGAYIPNEQSSYLKEAVSLHDATQKLDNALQAESDRAVGRENEIEANLNNEINRATEAENKLQEQITSNDSDIANLQTELDNTQAGIGLSDDGQYLPNAQASYINEATSIYDSTQKLDIALRAEADRSEAKDNELSDALANEIERATTAEENLANALQEEVTRATNKENEIQSELDNTQAAIGLNEDGTYKASEAASYINDATSVYDATVQLDQKLKETSDALESEQARAEAKEAELEKAIADEKARAEQAEQTLSDAITAEQNRAIEKENALQAELDATQTGSGLNPDGSYKANEQAAYLKEATSLYDATQKLDVALNKEETRSIAKDAELEKALNDEINRSTDKDEALQTEIDATQEGIGLSDDGKYLPNAQASYINEATSIYDSTQKLDIALAEEVKRSTTAEETLKDSIEAEQARAEAAEKKLTDDLTAEVNRATQAENDLQNQITNEVTRATNAEQALQTELDNTQKGSGLNEDGSYSANPQSNYLKEATSLSDATQKLDIALNEEVNRATTAEKTLTDNLAKEVERSTKADETLTQTTNNLQSELDATQAGAGLGLDGTYTPNPQSTYLKESTSLNDATQKLDVGLKEEVDRAKAAETDLQNQITELGKNTTVEVIDTNTVDLTKTTEQTGYSIKADVKVDSDNAANIIVTNSNGLTASVDLTYDRLTNKLTFSTTGNQSKEIQLSTHSIVDSITYDSTTESIVFIYSIDGVKQEPVVVPVHSLIQEWVVVNNSESPVKLSKKIVAGEGQDELSANVILSSDSDNILVNQNGALKVSNAQIELNKNSINKLQQDLNNEIDRASNVESNLQKALNDEITRATNKEYELENSLSEEVYRAKLQEQNLQNTLNQEIDRAVNKENQLEDLINSEITRATNEDSLLHEQLNSEIERAKQEELTIKNNLTEEINKSRLAEQQLSEDLSDEINRAVEVDNSLQEQVTTIKNSLDSEINRALAEDNDLRLAIQNEQNRAKLAEQTINDALLREELRASNSESIIQQNVDNVNTLLENEISRSTKEDETIKSLIETESNRAKDKENTLSTSIIEESNRAKLAEQDLQTQIQLNQEADESLKNLVLTNENKLNSEITRSTTKDEELSNAILEEKTRAGLEEVRLQESINTESNRAQRAEQQLTEDLNDEITRATHAEEVLTIKLNEEVTRAKEVESSLQNQINDLQNTQDGALEEAVTELEEMIQTETDRAIAAEQNLQEQIDDNVAKDAEQDAELAKKIETVELVKEADLQYTLYVDGEAAGTVVIPEDQFLKSVDYDQTTQILTFVFDTGAGEATTKINVSDLVDLYYAGHGLSLSNTNVFEVVIDSTSESFLTVSANGIKLNGVQSAIDTAVKVESDRAKTSETELQRQITENTNNIASTSEKLDKEIERSIAKDTELTEAIATEKARAELAEATLQNNINNEKVRAEAAELQLTTNLNNEIARAKESEQAITDRINNIETVTLVELTNKVDEEVQRSKDKDSALEKLIQDETNRATAAETQLSNDLAAETARAEAADEILENNITIEKNRAEAAEKNLSDRIDTITTNSNTEISDLKTALNNEISRSTEKDNEFATKLTEETNRATVAEQNVLNIVNNEITRSTEKDTFLETTINNEVTRAKEVENTLNTAITNEINRATAAERDLQNKINNLEQGSQGQLDDIVAKNEEQDIEIAKKIESVTIQQVSNLSYQLLVDGTSAGTINIPKDQFLKDVTYNTNSKELVFNFVTTEGDKTVTLNIADLIDAYKAGDGLRLDDHTFHISLDPTTESFLTVGPNGLKLNGVQTAINTAVETERNRALEAERVLQEQITKNTNDISNVSNRLEEKINEFTQKDLDLQNQITNEVNRAKIAEQDLQNQITNEVNRSTKADETLTTNVTNLTSRLDTEIQRSTQKDTELQRQIDNEVTRATNAENTIRTELQTQITNEVNRATTEEKRLETLVTQEIERAKESESEIIERVKELENNSVTNLQTQITDIVEKNKEQDTELAKKIESVELVKNSDLSYSVLVDGVAAGTIEIPEDQFLKDVTYSSATKEMTFTFDTGADTKTTIISLMDLITDTTYTAGVGLTLRDKQFKVVIDPGSEPYLSVGDNGVKLSGINTAIGNETNRAVAREDAILSQLQSEVSRATTAENKLQGAIDTTTTLVNSETTRAKEAEADLQEQIDTINSSIGGNVVNELEEIKQDITNIEGDVTNLTNRVDTLEDELDDHVKDFNNPHKVTKAQVGLDKVDNTTDLEKPISLAVQEALNNIRIEATNYATKDQLDDHKNDKNNPHNVTALQIGLGNVNNTSDADKPISLATQQALDKKADINHDHTMADITDLENFPVVSGFITSVDELPDNVAGGTKYIKANNGKYVLYEFDGGAGVWDEKIITSGMAASIIGGNLYKLNPTGSAYVRPERILDESDYKETYDRIWNETKDLIQSIEWEENDATSDSNGQIRLKITTKKTYAAPVVDENGNAVQPNVQPKVTYIDIDKTRFLKSAYSRPATQADVTNGYASKLGVPVLVMELTTGDEVVIDLSETMNIYDPVDTNSVDMSVSNWTGDANTSYKISANVRRNATEDVKDAVEIVETAGGLTANLTVKDTASINLTNDTKANGGLRADLVIDNDINNVSGVKLSVSASGLSATMVWGEYD